VDAIEPLEHHERGLGEHLIPDRFAGLQGRVAWPSAWFPGGWALLCGALASNHLRWQGDMLLTLALALLLVELAWSSLWHLAAGTDWFRPLAEEWPPAWPASWRGLPYTQPRSPGGRMVRTVNRLVGWWRDAFWPATGPALLALGAALTLTVVLTLLLPARLRLLNAALVALLGLGVVRRRYGQDSLAGQAVAQVGLSWLAGHLVLAEMSLASLGLALGFSAAALGMLKVQRGQKGGLWLIDGGQAACVLWLAAFGQPLAAGALGLLLLGQVALQPLLAAGAEAAPAVRRAWPWMMAAMLVAAIAIP
jgi:chlorophyll synthase